MTTLPGGVAKMWQDNALLLSLSQKSERLLLLNLITEEHGRLQSKMVLEAGHQTMLLPGSKLTIEYSPGDMGKLGTVKLLTVDGGVLGDGKDDTPIALVAYVNRMLTDLLIPEEPAQAIYAETEQLFTSLAVNDRRWPVHFARWEMAVIRDLGFARGFDRCRSAYNHGEQIYFSPAKGQAYPRDEVGAFLDQMMPVPAVLMGAKNASVTDVRQALDLTKLIYEKFVCQELGVEALSERREKILKSFRRFRTIPEAKADMAPGTMSEEDRKRRLHSLRPLLVQSRGSVT